MSSPFELRVDNFDLLYNTIAGGLGHTDFNYTEYTTNAPKSQFDTGHNDSYSYLDVPAFDSPLSSLSPSLSPFSSRINTPARDEEEESVASEEDTRSGSDSDSDVEPLSLTGEKAVIGNSAYGTSNALPQHYEEDFPWVPPQSQTSARSLRRRAQAKVVIAPTFDSDEEAVVASDDGDATDDEYLPTPPLKPLKRRRSQEPATSSLHSTPSIASSSRASSPAAARPTKRQRISRDDGNSKSPKKIRDTAHWTAEDREKWTCPDCDHVQADRRAPDLRRHQRTHTRTKNPTPYVCWGVLLEHAGVSKKPIPVDKRGIPVEHQGVMRIGGCLKVFSRLDALKRHLEKTKRGKQCATDFDDFCGVRDY